MVSAPFADKQNSLHFLRQAFFLPESTNPISIIYTILPAFQYLINRLLNIFPKSYVNVITICRRAKEPARP